MQELTPLDILEQKTALQTLEGDHRTALVALDEIAQQTVQKNVCVFAGASGAVSLARACVLHAPGAAPYRLQTVSLAAFGPLLLFAYWLLRAGCGSIR